METRPRSPLVPQSNLVLPRVWKRRDDGSPCGAPTSLGFRYAEPTFPHPFYLLKEDISNLDKRGHFYFGLTQLPKNSADSESGPHLTKMV